MSRNILVVDDEEDIREVIRYNLAREGYRVSSAADGTTALEMINREAPDLIILDLMLPGVDGLEICRQLKRKESSSGIPIIMVSAKGEESDIVSGLELGADDYVTKPFSAKVLVARVRALLRREPAASAGQDQQLRAFGIVLDPVRHEVRVDGEEILLGPTEFAILQLMLSHQGRVFPRSRIIDTVRGTGYAVTERSVDVQILGLRKKLGNAGACIQTVRGIGYRVKGT